MVPFSTQRAPRAASARRPSVTGPCGIAGDDLGQDLVLLRVLELDVVGRPGADAGIGIAAALVVGRDGIVVLLEVDDGDFEIVLAEPVGGILSSVELAATQTWRRPGPLTAVTFGL